MIGCRDLENKYMSAVATMEVFYLLVLFCDADMRNKLRFLCEMNRDTNRGYIRLDSLQVRCNRMAATNCAYLILNYVVLVVFLPKIRITISYI